MLNFIFVLLMSGHKAYAISDSKVVFTKDYRSFKIEYANSLDRMKRQYPNLLSKTFLFEQGPIDYFYLPAEQPSKKLILILSGVHGVEGFAGGAIQNWIIENKLRHWNKKLNVLMVNGFNPFGMKNMRRVNENNMDLNRSFFKQRDLSLLKNEHYLKIDAFLNPNESIENLSFHKARFIVESLFNILKFSLETLRGSIAGGQYEFPKGLFYGGLLNPKQDDLVTTLLEDFVAKNEEVLFIDLHTGYGENGKLHLLTSSKIDDELGKGLTEVFGFYGIDFVNKEKFYMPKGDLMTYLITQSKELKLKKVLGITFEYGTLDSQKTLGSIESLRRMVLENQNFWHPSSSVGVNADIKKMFEEMFNPDSAEWRLKIIEQTDNALSKIQ